MMKKGKKITLIFTYARERVEEKNKTRGDNMLLDLTKQLVIIIIISIFESLLIF